MRKLLLYWRNSLTAHLNVTILLLLLLLVSGCSSLGTQYTTLTSRDEVFILPVGTTFTALKSPERIPQQFIAPEDMVVVYKGSYLDLQKEANKQVFNKVRSKKQKAMVGGGIVSLLAIIAGIFKKLKKKK